MDEAQKQALEKQMEEEMQTAAAMEGAFRRGWHQGFAYAATVIETLWQQGYSLQQVRDMMTRFEDNKVQAWRADSDHFLDHSTTPHFSIDENLHDPDEDKPHDA